MINKISYFANFESIKNVGYFVYFGNFREVVIFTDSEQIVIVIIIIVTTYCSLL